MNNKEVLFELDSEITNLEFITRTFQALEIAVSEGASQVHSDAFTLPVSALVNSVEKLDSLIEQLWKTNQSKKEVKVA